MSIMQHGRRHEIEFYEPPTPAEWTTAIKEILGPDCPYMCVTVNGNRTIYVVEEIDIKHAATGRSLKLSGNTKVVPTTVVCATCKSQFNTLFVDFAHTLASTDAPKLQYRHFTKHCPNCPTMSTDAWLAYLGYYPSNMLPSDIAAPIVPPVDDNGISEYENIDMADFT